jgi:two-component system, OmpR family, osmolarity sensor histidine kinase EnvZ
MPEQRIGLFARTFLLLALLMLASLGAWLHVFFTLEAEPRASRVATEIERTVALAQAALQFTDPSNVPGLIASIEQQAPIRLKQASDGQSVTPLVIDPYWRAVSQKLTEKYGDQLTLAGSVDQDNAVWVGFKANEQTYWLRLTVDEFDLTTGPEWVSWVAAAALLSLVGAAVAVGYVNRPLDRLARAAQLLSRGETPQPLPEEGAIEIRELNASFNRMVSELQQADTDRRLMLAGISHDLRTPLARMRLEIEMSAMSDEQRRGIDQDLSQIDRTIGQLLEYARPARQPPKRPVNLLDVIQDVTDQEREHLSNGGTSLEVRAKSAAYCLIDRHDFSRCLLNLIENARRYGTIGAQPAQIEVALQTRADRIHIDVRDRGPGIAAKDVARMLRPFSRGEVARTGGKGAGLGLSIVERLLARAGGRLRLLPREGGGLVARIDLPKSRRARASRTPEK